jgi:hypothetical protein
MKYHAKYEDGFEFDYNNDGSIDGYTNLGEVYCSDVWVEAHTEKLSRLATEKNNGVVGIIYQYNNRYIRKQWFVAPSIRAYWCRHSE